MHLCQQRTQRRCAKQAVCAGFECAVCTWHSNTGKSIGTSGVCAPVSHMCAPACPDITGSQWQGKAHSVPSTAAPWHPDCSGQAHVSSTATVVTGPRWPLRRVMVCRLNSARASAASARHTRSAPSCTAQRFSADFWPATEQRWCPLHQSVVACPTRVRGAAQPGRQRGLAQLQTPALPASAAPATSRHHTHSHGSRP